MVTARELRASVFHEKKKKAIFVKIFKIITKTLNLILKEDKKISSLDGTV